MDSQENTRENWRALDAVHYDIRTDWQGVNAERFQRDFWNQFEYDVQQYMAALEDLAEAAREARRVMGE